MGHVIERTLLVRLCDILLDGFGVDRGWIDVQAGSGLPQVGNDKADNQS